MERHLEWSGCFNVRDLGGLPTEDGRRIARGALVRADSLSRLTAEGWQALFDHGVRTVIDLRNDEERAAGDHVPRPPQIRTHHLPLDNIAANDFWQGEWASGWQFGTPMYYRAHLLRFPDRSARVLAAIANAGPGGVAVHCVGGRDRTGQITMLALALAGVSPATIVADYELSDERLTGLWEALGEQDPGPKIAAFLRDRGTTAGQIIETTLSSIDLEGTLRGGGLATAELAALRARLLEPAPS